MVGELLTPEGHSSVSVNYPVSINLGTPVSFPAQAQPVLCCYSGTPAAQCSLRDLALAIPTPVGKTSVSACLPWRSFCNPPGHRGAPGLWFHLPILTELTNMCQTSSHWDRAHGLSPPLAWTFYL